MLDAWRLRLAPGRRLPERTALSPCLFGPLAPQMFVLAEDADGWRLRSAGALLDDLHGRPLVGVALADLWAEADRAAVDRLLDRARRRAEPVVAACRGETARGRAVALELTFAPATGPLGAPDRCLGLYQPLSPLARLGGEALSSLRLAEAPAPPPGPRLIVDNTRRTRLG